MAVVGNKILFTRQLKAVYDISVEFSSTSIAVMENIGTFVIYLVRSGKISNEVSIRVDTVEGTAEEGSDYRGVHGDFTMQPGQTELPIEMEISNVILIANARLILIDYFSQLMTISGSQMRSSF